MMYHEIRPLDHRPQSATATPIDKLITLVMMYHQIWPLDHRPQSATATPYRQNDHFSDDISGNTAIGSQTSMTPIDKTIALVMMYQEIRPLDHRPQSATATPVD